MTDEKPLIDAPEREAALDPARSFIVQAPAGSGKTELLIRRFLRLLATVNEPEQILAITFTRKAAGEMQGRILEALEAAAGAPPLSPHARETFELARRALERNRAKEWNLLDAPARLKVQTMDAFCAALTRQMPLLSGLGRQPMISDRPEELYRDAARRTIARIAEEGRNGEAVAEALRHLDNSYSGLEKRLIAMLAARDQWRRHMELKQSLSDAELRRLLEDAFRRLAAHALTRLSERFPSPLLSEAVRLGRYAASNLDGGEENRIVTLAGGIAPGTGPDDLPRWLGIAGLLLTGQGEWRRPGGITRKIGFPAGKDEEAVQMKGAMQALLEALASHPEEAFLREALSDLDILPGTGYDEKEWTILNDLLHLLPLAEEELTKIFAERGSADFPAVSAAALKALGLDESPTDLMLALDMKLRHILVDEYQDTSRTQLALIEALTRGWEPGDGRTLFIVGDPMQSIYLFRDAEVGLFLEAEERGIGGIPLEALKLRSNFRSRPEIIGWVNRVFQGSFPGEGDSFLGAVPYTAFSAVRPSAGKETVKTVLYDGRSDQAEAEEIVSLIKTLRREAPGASIALLARSRSHLSRIVEAFKSRGIDFRTTDLDPLAERPVVRDLTALLRALMHPFDRTAWLAILRAPFCGLTLSDLLVLCIKGEGCALFALLHDEARLARLSPGGRKRLKRIMPPLRQAMSLRGRVRPRGLLEGLWTALGGPACTDGEGLADSARFLDMVDEVSEGGAVPSPEALEEQTAELFADHRGREGIAVELLTIHRAKGLEFDHVILPGIGKPTRPRERRLIRLMERGADLLIAPMEGTGEEGEGKTYRCLGRMEEKKEAFEQMRLFYVAATRAREGLHLFGHFREKEGAVSGESRSFLAAAPALLDDFTPRQGGKIEETADTTPKLRLRRLPERWTFPDLPPTLAVERAGTEGPARSQTPEFLWAGEGIKHLGTALHRSLSRMAGTDLSRWDAGRLSREEGEICALLRQLGVNREEAAELAAEGISMLQKMLKDERGRWILAPHPEGRTEYPLSAVQKREVIRRVIDRTFVETETRWIIDYKVSRHGGDLRAFLENERERYRAQLDEYETILKAGGEKRQIRKGLYYPAQSGWIEW